MNHLWVTILKRVKVLLFVHSQLISGIPNSNSFICTQLDEFKYCYLTLIVLSNIICSFATF